jgi:hypothetical protein
MAVEPAAARMWRFEHGHLDRGACPVPAGLRLPSEQDDDDPAAINPGLAEKPHIFSADLSSLSALMNPEP